MRKLGIPVKTRHNEVAPGQYEIASTCANLKLLEYPFDTDLLDDVSTALKSLRDSLVLLEGTLSAETPAAPVDAARHACQVIMPAMNAVREYVDDLEGLVADDLWPLPTYQEMLFIK